MSATTQQVVRVGRMATSRLQLATRLPDWSAGGPLRHSAAHLVRPCVGVALRSPRARHARLVADILARISRADATRKTASVEFVMLLSIFYEQLNDDDDDDDTTSKNV